MVMERSQLRGYWSNSRRNDEAQKMLVLGALGRGPVRLICWLQVGDEEEGVEHAPRSLLSDRNVALCIRKEDPGERSCRSGTMGSVSEFRLSVLP